MFNPSTKKSLKLSPWTTPMLNLSRLGRCSWGVETSTAHWWAAGAKLPRPWRDDGKKATRQPRDKKWKSQKISQKTQREKMLTKSLELLKLWPHPICGYIYDYIWLVLGSRNNSMPSAPAGGMIPVCRSCEVPISRDSPNCTAGIPCWGWIWPGRRRRFFFDLGARLAGLVVKTHWRHFR
jgi:hypothetical protein